MIHNGVMFITRNGRHVPEAATDQAGSEALIRTVSRYTDGKPIDRPQICVSLQEFGAQAQNIAEDLDRRGYLPPDVPMTRAEFASIEGKYRDLVWAMLGLGLPLGMACHRLGLKKTENLRTHMKRMIKEIGWGSDQK